MWKPTHNICKRQTMKKWNIDQFNSIFNLHSERCIVWIVSTNEPFGGRQIITIKIMGVGIVNGQFTSIGSMNCSICDNSWMRHLKMTFSTYRQFEINWAVPFFELKSSKCEVKWVVDGFGSLFRMLLNKFKIQVQAILAFYSWFYSHYFFCCI